MKNIGLIGIGLLSLGLQLSGCSAEVEPKDNREGCYVGDPDCLPRGGTKNGPASDGSAAADPDSTAAPDPDATPPSGSNPAAGPATDLPCGVAQVVSGHCSACHAEQPKFGALMPLTKLADFHAPAKSDPKRKVYELVPERINEADSTRRMPPASSPALSAGDLSMLDAWAKAGAKPDTSGATCTPAADPPGAPGGATMPSTPIDYNDPEMKCYRFQAHAAGDKMQPFGVGTTPDMYKGFTFMPPWKGMMYARSFKAIIDNPDVIHHWLFFRNAGPGEDGAVSDQIGAHPDGNLVIGWAPGGQDLYLDPDVGQEMPGEVSYMLEAHYNNTGSSMAPDASGVEVCVTPKVPKNVASISWLGTDLILGANAEGTCKPNSKEPITIIGGTPHMHLKGRHMKVVINRADGTKDTLTDQPFDFEYQISYNFKKLLNPGDTITTTCTYSEPSSYGRGTNDEMCYLFTLYYPKLSLTNGDPLASQLHGPDTCLGGLGGPGSLGGGDMSDDDAMDDGNLIPGVDIPFIPGI